MPAEAHRPRMLLALLLGTLLAASTLSVGAATEPLPGTVTGTVSVSQARVRTGDPKGGKEVIVYLEPIGAALPAAVPGSAEMDQKGLVFLPHVLAVRTGTTVKFLNNDNVEHNVYLLDEQSGATLDLGTWAQGVSISHTFTTAGTTIILCKLHLDMAAYVVVLDTPWYTTAILEEGSQQARFRIDGVPPGSYRVLAWHKKLRLKVPPPQVSVGAGKESTTQLVITKARYAQ